MSILGEFIFIIVAFALFVVVFYKMIVKNDTGYVAILALQAIGISIDFIKLIFKIENMNIMLRILSFLLAIILPIMVLIFNGKDGSFKEKNLMLKVKFLLLFKNNKAAKEALLKIIEQNPNNYMAHKLLADIYEQEGGIRKAIDEYVQVVDIQKTDYDTYYKIASLLTELDKKTEATQMLTNLLQKNPEHLEATKLLGDLLIEQESYKEAVNIYLEAEKYHPGNFDIYYNLGIVYTMLNDFQNAKMYYERAAQINTLLNNSKYNLAEIALIYKELDEAEKNFLEIVEDPELEADGYFELAKISLIKKDKEKAINYANIAIESNPKKIVEKIKNDDIFITILAKLTIPFNLEIEEEKTTKLSKKEKLAKEHLESMSDVARKLGYNDIKLLNKLKEEKEIKYKEEKKSNKEREQ